MSTLVLYDTTGAWGWLGEMYGIMTANLASHFGPWTAQPIAAYQAGQMSQYTATIYIGSTYDEPIPSAFLNDVNTVNKPVIWIYYNIWQLTAATPNFLNTYGWNWSGIDTSSVGRVDYKGQQLKRYSASQSGIMGTASLTNGGPTVLGQAVRDDGTAFPWAVRSRNLTYICENPLSYIAEGDRYLAFCDLLFDALAPSTATQHRALVRLEDINPVSDPNPLRQAADYLASRGVPFGFIVSPLYKDPLGTYNNGVPQTLRLRNAPDVISALKYLVQKGGTLVEHGYTHQYSNVLNPYDAVSGDDFEFYRVTQNADNTLNFQGPVPEDSTAWALNRIRSSRAEFVAAGLPAPTLFTFPHYFASAADYKAASQVFTTRYERSLYFKGLLSGGAIDPTRVVGQFSPYVIRDVYGMKVLPDNLGTIEPVPFYQFPVRLPADVIADARRSLVVRDGFASFFYNMDNGLSYLQTTVEGLQGMGYTFVSQASL